MKPIKFVDVETTGLDPLKHEIIEIAVVPLDDNQPPWRTYIKPERIEDASPKALEINGYAAHPELWDDAPTLIDVAPTIRTQLAGCLPAGQNVPFDMGFIQAALQKYELWHGITHHKFDVMALAVEHLAPCGLHRLSLNNICDFLGISNEGAHSALTDALRAKQVYKTLVRASRVDRLIWATENRVESFFHYLLDLVTEKK